MSHFMDHMHPDAFVDFSVRSPEYGMTKMCPRCQGHGGWNLKLNAYRLPEGYEDNSYNRNRYVHFHTLCGNCNGYGYVHESQTCVHDWEYSRGVGKCLTEYKCVHCGQLQVIDSSD